jgi:peptide/nickel transport system permease protein
VGSTAGYFKGNVDDALMRVSEAFLVIPVFFIAVIFLKVFLELAISGFGVLLVILIIGLFYWAPSAMMIRGEFLRIRELEFVEAARSIGAGSRRIIFRQILPNVLPSIIVVTSLAMADVTIIEAAIGFLGFGDPNTVTWGLLLQEGFTYLRLQWWGEVFPGLVILFFALGFNLLGDGLQDALNPRLRE